MIVSANKTATEAVLGGAGLIITTCVACAACDAGGARVHICSSSKTTTQLLNSVGVPLEVNISPSITFGYHWHRGACLPDASDVAVTFGNSNPKVNTTGTNNGINADNNGAGALGITTTSTTTSTNSHGIYEKTQNTLQLTLA